MNQELRILIIEDDQIDRMLIKNVLSKSDVLISATAVDNGKDALELIKSKQFDFCFCDYKLPDCNGLDLILKFKEKNVNFPIVIITGNPDQELSTKALKNGATNYLTKSLITPEALSLIIRNSIEMKKIEKELKDVKNEASKGIQIEQSSIMKLSMDISHSINTILNTSNQMLINEKNLDKKNKINLIQTSAENLKLKLDELINS